MYVCLASYYSGPMGERAGELRVVGCGFGLGSAVAVAVASGGRLYQGGGWRGRFYTELELEVELSLSLPWKGKRNQRTQQFALRLGVFPWAGESGAKTHLSGELYLYLYLYLCFPSHPTPRIPHSSRTETQLQTPNYPERRREAMRSVLRGETRLRL